MRRNIKKLSVLLMIVAFTVPIFAEEDMTEDKRMAVNIDPSLFILGPMYGILGGTAGFEYAPVRSFSVKASVFYVNVYDPGMFLGDDANIYMLNVTLEGRWYPQGNYVDGFFLNGGLQFQQLVALFDFTDIYGRKDRYHNEVDTFGFFVGLGYKVVFGKTPVGFFLEPALTFNWPFYSTIPFNEMDAYSGNLIGWLLGVKLFRPGLVFGIAF